MSPVGITLMLSVALAGFAALCWRKLSIVAALGPDPRWDAPLARLRTVWENGFLQRRMIARDRRPGVMHAVLFLGFLALLARKIQLIAIGYDERFVYPGWVGGAFATLKDGVELAVLAAVGYGFYRRSGQRPARLEPNREAWLVLGLITAIMLTDLAFDGFRFALFTAGDAGIAHERSFAFAGDAVASAVAGWPRAVLEAGYQLSYWVQLATVFTFLVILPVGEHFHIVTALPVLYFRRGRPANAVPGVDLEAIMGEGGDADTMKVGVRTVADLTWKEGLDAFTCTECGRCKDACPTFLTGKPLSQKWVHDSLKHHLVAQRTALLGDEAARAALPPLIGEVIAEDTLWACTTCGYCETACPIELEHLPRFYRLRQHRVMMDGEFPHELKAVFDAYQSQSNPWGLPADTRGDWARGLDVPVLAAGASLDGYDYLFYVGSASSFDPRGQKIARACVAILRHAGVRFAILGAAETSTGECVRRAGNEMLFQELAATLVGTLDGAGAKRILCSDPHAYNSLRNEYPAFGGNYEVIHHTRLIAELIEAGRLALAPSFERVIYHEPCYLSRHNGEYEAPRAVLRHVVRDAPLEFELAREKAMCCGAGGARMWLEETIGERINVLRVKQALPQAPRVIATACPYCAVMIGDGLKALGREDDVANLDIAELVAGALVPAAARPAAA
jgi:Fe-S oxidoreductase